MRSDPGRPISRRRRGRGRADRGVREAGGDRAAAAAGGVRGTDVVQKDVPGVSGSRRADAGIPGRRHPRARRRLPRDRQFPRGVVRPQRRSALHDRPRSRSRRTLAQRKPIRRRPRRGSRRRTTTSPAIRRSSPSRRSASRNSTTRAPRRTLRTSQVDAAKSCGGEGDARSRATRE